MNRLYDTLNDKEAICDIIGNYQCINDIVTSLCGEKIGFGASRNVFEYGLDNKYVIKIESKTSESNMSEAMLWEEIKELQGNLAWVKNWFAPVKWISPNGRILVMQKTMEMPHKERPNKIPSFFFDAKWNNFGWIGNRFVCHDYGIPYGLISYSKKMRTITW